MTSTSKPRATSIDTATAALALVALTIVIALGVGFAVGVASAFLVFVTGALLGAILLVWHSLRTLTGDAEVDPTLETTISARAPTELGDKKRRALRALKDLEQEHSLGKIDEADYKELAAQYREQAKDVIREMDDAIAPYREKAEALVEAHLAKQKKIVAEKATVADQRACPECETKNDADATFCKKCGEKLASEDA